jgi:GNAT superfamily N-acetyltransferase
MSTQLKSVTYRIAKPEDLSRIVHFQISMAWETEKFKLNHDTVTQGVGEVFRNPHRGQYFVAESSGKIVGCLLTLPEWSDWRNGEVWWIHSVYVEQESRSKGVYKGLYLHLKEVAQNRKDVQVRGLRLYVDKTNETAQKVYRALGMSDDHYHLFEWMTPER